MKDQNFSIPNQNQYILKKYGYDIAVTFAKTEFKADGIDHNLNAGNVGASYNPPLLVTGKVTQIGNVGNAGNLVDYQGRLLYYYVGNNQAQGQQPTYRAIESGAYFNYGGYGGTNILQGSTGQFVSYTQDFTFEYFLKSNNNNLAGTIQFGFGYPTYGNKNWNLMGLNDGSVLKFVWTTGESFTYYSLDLAASNSVFDNDFCHVAVTRQNGVLRSFLNGSLIDTDSSAVAAANFNDTGAALMIAGGNGGNPTNALFSNIRYVVGTALYTGNFDVPSIPLQIVNGSGTRLLVTGYGTEDSSLWAGTDFEYDPAASGNAAIISVDNPYA